MREAVWRNAAAYMPGAVDSASGVESGTAEINTLLSKEDVNRWINEALTAHYVNMVANSNTTWADEAIIDVKKDKVEYTLPEDLAQLRSCWWKPVDIEMKKVPPSERIYMHLLDEATDLPESSMNGAPTYRRNLNYIVINDPKAVDRDNDGGVLVRYIKWVNYLAKDDDRIETQFARVLQEMVILDATVAGLSRKFNLPAPQELQLEIARWETRLATLLRNTTSAPFVQMIPTQHPGVRR